MIAAMGGLDAVAFTGGIGENCCHDIRKVFSEQLRWLGDFPTYIVPARRKLHIAREAQDLLETR